MDDRKIEVLLATVRTGSFSKAAEETNCTQSAVTQIMNNMEAELNLKILDRSHKGVKLTSAGESLMPYIIEADTALERLRIQAKSICEGREVPIRIGTFSSIANSWLPTLLKEYRAEHPETSFHLEIGTSMLTPWILNGMIDVALGDAERCKGLRFYELMDDPFMAAIPADIAPEGDTVTQEEFSSLPFVMAPGNAPKTYLQEVPAGNLNVVTDDDASLFSIVAQGLGATVLPKLSLEFIPDNPSVKIMNLVPKTVRKLGIGVGNSPDRRVADFVAFVRERIKNIQ
ncbi:MAG: LysR family transcriptional regulator [Anaerovoracaceae bacterium]